MTRLTAEQHFTFIAEGRTSIALTVDAGSMASVAVRRPNSTGTQQKYYETSTVTGIYPSDVVTITAESGSVEYAITNLSATYSLDPTTGAVTGLVGPDGETVLNIANIKQFSQATSIFRWVTADAGNTTSITTSTPIITDPIDVTGAFDGSLTVVTSGGTLAISYEISGDGKTWFSGGSLASGLSAGTYAYSLANIKLETGFFRITLTATGSTCSVKAFVMATSAAQSSETRQIRRGVFGDGSAAVSVAASGAIVSPPIDLTRCVRSRSILRVVVASGTFKISAVISRNGSDDVYSLGDIQTGMTSGSYTFDLNALSRYGHFVTFTLTETAGAAASASGYALLSVSDRYVGDAAPRRVAVFCPVGGFSGSNWSVTFAKPTMQMYSMLLRMGYDAEILPLDDASTIMDSGAKLYEFAVYASTSHSSLWTTWTSGVGKPVSRLLKGETAIPVFAIGCSSSNNAVLLANIGAGVRDTEINRKILIGDEKMPWYAVSTGSYAVTVQSHMGSFTTIATDSTETGKVAWAYTGAKGRVYVSAGFNGTGDGNLFPFLFGHAIADGVVSYPPKKLQTVIDIDDMPACDGGATGIMTLQDLQRVYAAMQTLGMPCSFGIRVEDITAGRQSPDLSRFVSDRTADKGGLIYPIVHNGNWFWKDGAKSVKDANYKADIAVASGAGIPVGSDASRLNGWGYMYFNNNAFDEDTTQLGQDLTVFSASVDDLSVKAGYGWSVIRADVLGGNNTEGIGEPVEVFGKTLHRGLLAVASHNHISSSQKSIDFDDGSTGTALISLQCARFIRYTMAYGVPFYIHGQNCFDGHDSGDAPGTRWLELIAGHWPRIETFTRFVHGAALKNDE